MTNAGRIFLTEAETGWEDLGNGVQRQIFGYDETLMLVKVKFETGATGAMHSHVHAQSTFVASGSFEFTIGQEKKIINAGDGCFMPANVMHGCLCLQAGMLIDAFSPYREDFVNDTTL
ncbi:cupin domain-containing protein [Ferruginibacter profundus]